MTKIEFKGTFLNIQGVRKIEVTDVKLDNTSQNNKKKLI